MNDLANLLRNCEARLIDSRRSLDDALDLVRRTVDALSRDDEISRDLAHDQGPHEELVELVLSALEQRGARAQTRNDYLRSLIYRDDEDHYRVGRRELALTESERHILDALWDAAPAPVSRQQLHHRLYGGEGKASLGTIDVFVSNLRQKLKLAGGGRDFLQSSRGLGWALRHEFCRNSVKPADAPAANGERQRA